jgi:hypothetical protein
MVQVGWKEEVWERQFTDNIDLMRRFVDLMRRFGVLMRLQSNRNTCCLRDTAIL